MCITANCAVTSFESEIPVSQFTSLNPIYSDYKRMVIYGYIHFTWVVVLTTPRDKLIESIKLYTLILFSEVLMRIKNYFLLLKFSTR
jgi:hypothetical protein